MRIAVNHVVSYLIGQLAAFTKGECGTASLGLGAKQQVGNSHDSHLDQ